MIQGVNDDVEILGYGGGSTYSDNYGKLKKVSPDLSHGRGNEQWFHPCRLIQRSL